MAFAIFFPAFFALVVVSMKPAMLSGYSSLRLAMAVPGVRVVTIDVAGCPTVKTRRRGKRLKLQPVKAHRSSVKNPIWFLMGFV